MQTILNVKIAFLATVNIIAVCNSIGTLCAEG